MSLGIGEIALILIVGLVVVGPKKLPELARSIGRSMRAFQKGLRDLTNDLGADTGSVAGPDNRARTASQKRLKKSSGNRSG